MHTLVLSILAAVQIGGAAVTKVDANKVVPLPVVKAVGFGAGASGGFGNKINDQSSKADTNGTVGGQEADGWVELSAPAPCVTMCGSHDLNGNPTGGMFVQVSSSNPSVAKVQAPNGLIRVSTGKTRQTFTVLTFGVSSPTRVTISAWREGSAPQTTTLYVVPPSLMGLAIDQVSVTGGIGAHGSVTFKLVNKGKLAHDIRIAGKTSKLIKPGKTGKFVVTLKKGKYVYNCPIPGHTAAGMKGKLTVT